MKQAIVNFFKEIFKDDLCMSLPTKREKIPKKKIIIRALLYWTIGPLVCVIVTAVCVYIEVWEFKWNIIQLIWPSDANNYMLRGGYVICGMSANILFLMTGYLTTSRINGNKQMVECKKLARLWFIFCYILAIACYIISLIVY